MSMSFRDSIRDPEKRTRLLALILAMGAVAALPTPSDVAATSLARFLVPVLWISFGAFAWSVWFREDLQWTLWFSSTVLALVAALKGLGLLPLVLSVVWALWYSTRRRRESRLKGWAILFLASVFSPQVGAEGIFVKKPAAIPGTIEIPTWMTGNKLSDLASCASAEKIQWKFRSDNRKTRMILKDVLRLGSDTKFATWEIHQVMDKDGYVTYIFRKTLANGRYESIVAKENLYNKIVDTPRGQRVVEVQNLKSLINRPVFIFYHSDGSTVSYLPGLAGRSTLIIQLAQAEGLILPPVYFKGSSCDRPNDTDQVGGGTTDFEAAPKVK